GIFPASGLVMSRNEWGFQSKREVASTTLEGSGWGSGSGWESATLASAAHEGERRPEGVRPSRPPPQNGYTQFSGAIYPKPDPGIHVFATFPTHILWGS